MKVSGTKGFDAPVARVWHVLNTPAELAKTLPAEQIVLICLSGRGDKDMESASKLLRL